MAFLTVCKTILLRFSGLANLPSVWWKSSDCRDAVREEQAVVCGLHRGLTRGLLEVLSPQSELAAFVHKDPDAAGCLIRLRGPVAEQPD